MELKLIDGDYVPDTEAGSGFETVAGDGEALQRVLYKLTAHRGSFPFMPELGSRLWLLGREKRSARDSAARQFVAEALEDEDGVKVTDVQVTELNDSLRVDVKLLYDGTVRELAVEV
jgi:hypothetical protein